MSRHIPRKRFGQNFLRDENVIERIVGAIKPDATDRMVEIGPGEGAMTRHLAPLVEKLTVIELDRDLAAALQADPAYDNVEVIQADILRLKADTLPTNNFRLVGNLPYNISSPIVFWALGLGDRVRDMHFMLQKEVVDRMVAAPGSKTYGRLSVMVQHACHAERLFTVAPGSFYPPPKVQSAIVRLTVRAPAIPVTDHEIFETVVRNAFGQRRKTIANALKGVAGREALEAAGINPGARAETLSVEQYATLANQIVT